MFSFKINGKNNFGNMGLIDKLLNFKIASL